MIIRKANFKTAMWDCPEWEPIPGFPMYQIHWRGAIRNAETKLLLRPGLGGSGYLSVVVFNDTRKKTVNIHRLVAEIFVNNPENKKVAHHGDNIKINNHYKNIRWVTYSENNSMAIMHGLKKSAIQAKGVIKMDMHGHEIARYHSSEHAEGFSSGNICHVCNGKRNQHGGFKWKWVNN